MLNRMDVSPVVSTQKSASRMSGGKPANFGRVHFIKQIHQHTVHPGIAHHTHYHGDTYVGGTEPANGAGRRRGKSPRMVSQGTQTTETSFTPDTHYGRLRAVLKSVVNFLKPAWSIIAVVVGFVLTRVNIGFQIRPLGLPFT